MDSMLFATKGNLILAKNTLRLSLQGYELLDKKRTILVNEMMSLMGEADELQKKIDFTFREAYDALQQANITEGIMHVKQLARAVPIHQEMRIKMRSVMGVEIPQVDVHEEYAKPTYGFMGTSMKLDKAKRHFDDVRILTGQMAEVENAIYRLATNIKKTQRRANALKNIIIPRYETIVADITNVLEEKEREEFTRLKVVKRNKLKKSNR